MLGVASGRVARVDVQAERRDGQTEKKISQYSSGSRMPRAYLSEELSEGMKGETVGQRGRSGYCWDEVGLVAVDHLDRAAFFTVGPH